MHGVGQARRERQAMRTEWSGSNFLVQCSTAKSTIASRSGAIHARLAFAGENSGKGQGSMRLQYFRGNIFVANLPPDLTEDQLAEAFDPFGIVLSASIARDPETGKRLRYGFVDIATERAAKLAVEAMNGTAIEGHNIDVRISERPNKAKKPTTARVGPRRALSRPTLRRNDEDHNAPSPFTPRIAARRQPTFEVERRPLPRRF